MKKLIASLAVLALCTSSLTYAGWQGLEWGMSPAATGRKCVDTYTAGPFAFDVECRFNPGLTQVDLILDPLKNSKPGDLLLSVLKKKYGLPVQAKDGPLLTIFVWSNNGDQISYIKMLGSPARVNYQSLKTSGAEGL